MATFFRFKPPSNVTKGRATNHQRLFQHPSPGRMQVSKSLTHPTIISLKLKIVPENRQSHARNLHFPTNHPFSGVKALAVPIPGVTWKSSSKRHRLKRVEKHIPMKKRDGWSYVGKWFLVLSTWSLFRTPGGMNNWNSSSWVGTKNQFALDFELGVVIKRLQTFNKDNKVIDSPVSNNISQFMKQEMHLPNYLWREFIRSKEELMRCHMMSYSHMTQKKTILYKFPSFSGWVGRGMFFRHGQ